MTTARRVGLVVGQLQTGGAERQLYELAVRLDRTRYEPVVVCLSEVGEPFASRLASRGIRVILLQRSRNHDPARLFKLSHVLREERVDLLHSFLLAANAYAWSAALLARASLRRVPLIASSRTCIPPVNRFLRAVHRRAFLGAAVVIANSNRVMEFTRDHYALPAHRIRVIPNGVDLEPFGPEGIGPGARDAIRRELGIPAGARVVGTLGRISPEKNLGLFLRMAKSLSAGEDAGVLFVIAGGGPLVSALRLQAADLGLSGRVHFLGPRQDVARVLSAFDLFVLTSDTEGLPNAVMEAMAARLPVVATRVGGTVELVEEDKTGFLVDPGDLDRLTARVRALLPDEETRRRMGHEGRRRIEAGFSADLMVRRTVALYDEVLS